MALGNIGKYERLDVLGHGTSGIVYLAWDSLLRRHVALKEVNVHADEEAKFLEEARLLDRLRHPNIVQVNGVDRIDGRMLIDMEYVKGTNLNEYLRRKKQLPVREALSIAVQVCSALDFAHRNHTVHRDVKPANVLISDTGIAKLVDFGLAEILGSGSYAGGAGTYAYMAPEDFDEIRHSDYRSDIWAMGVTLYEMISGRRPFQSQKAKDPFAWKRLVTEEEPVPLTDLDPLLPKDLDMIVSRAMAKDMRERYQSAKEMHTDMMKILMALGGPLHLSSDAPKREIPPISVADAFSEPSYQRRVDAHIVPDRLSFGKLRKGDAAKQFLDIKVEGRGKTAGRVVSQPGWITVDPQFFDHRKQRLTVTADSASIWNPGMYNEQIELEIEGEQFVVPLHALIVAKRRSFIESAWWYIPLLLLSMLPLIIAMGSFGSRLPGSQTVSLISSGMLCAILFVIAIVADLSLMQRIVPLLLFCMCLGTAFGMLSGGGIPKREGLYIFSTGAVFSMLLALQLMTYSGWKAWAVMHALIAIGITAVLLH